MVPCVRFRFSILFSIWIGAIAAAGLLAPPSLHADQGANGTVGVVVMHGKGGSPQKHVTGLVSALEAKGFRVANLDMPWSGRRNYDVDVQSAENEVEAAIEKLRAQGATRFVVAGHSLGGLFALQYAGKHPVIGVVAMAPGGYANAKILIQKLGKSVSEARQLVASGKGAQPQTFDDYESAKGVYSVNCPSASYLSWFDPEGEMTTKALTRLSPKIPVLFIVPTGDYPALRNPRQKLFDMLPKNKMTQLAEPESDHLGAPHASIGLITEWLSAVSSGT